MQQKPSKFAGFFNLIEAMKLPGCPVCHRIAVDVHHAMDSFLYESVNDPGLREEIRDDHGLCRHHAWKLAQFGDTLGSAILFGDILESILPSIGSRTFQFNRRTTASELGQQTCLFCRTEHQAHDSVLAELTTHIEDQELKLAWQGPAVLCIPHLSQLARQVHDPVARDRLIASHRPKYEQLCQQMRELIAKQSYDRCAEPAGPEKDSWLRAIEVLVGRVELR